MTRITPRSVPDLGGKPVDVIPVPRHVSALVLEPAPGQDRESVCAVLLDAMLRLRGRSKRLTDRDYVVWFGEFTNRYGSFSVVCLPERFDSDLHVYFQDALRHEFDRFRDIMTAPLADTSATPLLRWDHGRVILYRDGFAASSDRDDGVEERSCDLADRAMTPVRREPLPLYGEPASPFHSIQTWPAIQQRALSVIGSMIGPASYGSLKRFATHVCGVTVRERSGLRRHGQVQVGWLTEAGMTATVLISEDLRAELKYAVLAHELAHYLLHFPILLAGQIAEMLSWEHPAYENRYRSLFSGFFPAEHPLLEADANYLSSYFHVPRWVDAGGIEKVLHMRDRSPTRDELVWDFLQPMFPETAGSEQTWTNLDERRETAARESMLWTVLGAEPQSLYETVAAAVFGRQSEHRNEVRATVDDHSFDLLAQVEADLGSRSVAGEHSAADELPQETTAVRDLVPPLSSPTAETLPRRVPLVPARTPKNREPKWMIVTDTERDARTLAEWRAAYPDRAMALYPHHQQPEHNG